MSKGAISLATYLSGKPPHERLPRFVLHSNSISERGDSVALLELSLALKTVRFDVMVVFWAGSDANSQERIDEFETLGIQCVSYRTREDLELICENFQCSHFLTFSDGTKRGSAYCRDDPENYRIGQAYHIVWAVFRVWDPHGDLYLYVSRWNYYSNFRKVLGRFFGGSSHETEKTRVSFLEHFLSVKESLGGASFRETVGIPDGSPIVGRIGGHDQFSDVVAQAAVLRVLRNEPDLYFVFVNTLKFTDHPRVIFVSQLSRSEVWDFYSACQVLLNGRLMGESFGFGIVESLRLGKPVVAPHWIRNLGMDKNHITLLRGLGLLYRTERHLARIILRQVRTPLPRRLLMSRVKHTVPERGLKRLLSLILIKNQDVCE